MARAGLPGHGPCVRGSHGPPGARPGGGPLVGPLLRRGGRGGQLPWREPSFEASHSVGRSPTRPKCRTFATNQSPCTFPLTLPSAPPICPSKGRNAMEYEMTDFLPGAVTPYGPVAYATATHVWVYTMAGVRCYRTCAEPVPATKGQPVARPSRLHLVSRRAA